MIGLDWLASLMTLLCVTLVGHKKRVGFLVGALSEPLWFYLMLRAHYYGLAALGVVFFLQYIWAYLKWRREDHDRQPVADHNQR